MNEKWEVSIVVTGRKAQRSRNKGSMEEETGGVTSEGKEWIEEGCKKERKEGVRKGREE